MKSNRHDINRIDVKAAYAKLRIQQNANLFRLNSLVAEPYFLAAGYQASRTKRSNETETFGAFVFNDGAVGNFNSYVNYHPHRRLVVYTQNNMFRILHVDNFEVFYETTNSSHGSCFTTDHIWWFDGTRTLKRIHLDTMVEESFFQETESTGQIVFSVTTAHKSGFLIAAIGNTSTITIHKVDIATGAHLGSMRPESWKNSPGAVVVAHDGSVYHKFYTGSSLPPDGRGEYFSKYDKDLNHLWTIRTFAGTGFGVIDHKDAICPLPNGNVLLTCFNHEDETHPWEGWWMLDADGNKIFGYRDMTVDNGPNAITTDLQHIYTCSSLGQPHGFAKHDMNGNLIAYHNTGVTSFESIVSSIGRSGYFW